MFRLFRRRVPVRVKIKQGTRGRWRWTARTLSGAVEAVAGPRGFETAKLAERSVRGLGMRIVRLDVLHD